MGAVHFSSGPCWPIDTTYFIDEFYELDPFLTHALRTLKLSEHDTSTAIPGLNRDDLYAQQMPLASLPEQKRIVAKVEELLDHVNASREHLAKASKILTAFRQSVLAAACSGRLTEDWCKKRPELGTGASFLAEILVERRMRFRKAAQEPPQGALPELPPTWCAASIDQLISEPLANGRSVVDREGGFPVLRLTALKNGRIDLSERKSGAWTLAEARPFLVSKGDFLVSRGNGSLRLVGRGGLVESKPNPVAYPDTLIRVRVTQHLDASFLACAWDSPLMRSQIEARAHTTAGIHKISQQDISLLAIPLPPPDEQEEIARRSEALFKLADTIEKGVGAATRRADKLTQAILAKAFRGELVPTEAELARREGRSYEPASVLRERIKSEYQKEAASKNTARRDGDRKQTSPTR